MFLLGILFICHVFRVNCVDVEDTDLVYSFLVNRHGDRTPLEVALKYSNDPEGLRAASIPFGFENLTNIGRDRCFALGEDIRQRYDSLLSSCYDQDELYIESTPLQRTKETADIIISALYWGCDVKHKVHIKTFPMFDCPEVFRKLFETAISSEYDLVEYSNLMETLSSLMGRNYTTNPFEIYALHDLIDSQLSLGYPEVPSGVVSLLPQLWEAASTANAVIFGGDSIVSMVSGPSLENFYEDASAAIAGAKRKIRIQSSHDLNVYTMTRAIGVPDQGPAFYTATIALELRRDANKNHYVLAVYIPFAEGKPLYLPMKGCGGLLCEYKHFKKITRKFVSTEKEKAKICEDENKKE